jgi:hypothetical protein
LLLIINFSSHYFNLTSLSSIYFESLLAWFECTLKHRPPAASRFSGVCERLFGTANTQFLYNSVVWGFQLHLPLPEVPDLLSNWDYCYERSLGCIGILKNWLRNALADAIAESAVTVGKKHLERRALGVAQCRNILKKIIAYKKTRSAKKTSYSVGP